MGRDGSIPSSFDGLPKWVKVVAVVGLPAVLALGLTYVNETRFYEKLNTAQTNTEKIMFSMEQQDESMKSLINALKDNNQEMIKSNRTNERLIRLTCSGIVDPETKRACWKEE